MFLTLLSIWVSLQPVEFIDHYQSTLTVEQLQPAATVKQLQPAGDFDIQPATGLNFLLNQDTEIVW